LTFVQALTLLMEETVARREASEVEVAVVDAFPFNAVEMVYLVQQFQA